VPWLLGRGALEPPAALRGGRHEVAHEAAHEVAKDAANDAAADAAKGVPSRRAWERTCTAGADAAADVGEVCDVVANAAGEPMLLPVHGGPSRAVTEVPEDEVVTVRVFRFFEDKADHDQIWERELRNVNSGSLLWLAVHLEPGKHSLAGAKYGRWFAVHHVRVRARLLVSNGYFMFEEGCCPLAKHFGATSAIRGLISGDKLATGYYWFASPDRPGAGASHKDVTDQECMEKFGWQHAGFKGLFSGDEFLDKWRTAIVAAPGRATPGAPEAPEAAKVLEAPAAESPGPLQQALDGLRPHLCGH